MDIRKRLLPAGWYPDTEGEIRKMIEEWGGLPRRKVRSAVSGVAPHAGWFFSGELAWQTISAIDADSETIAVIGGHLGFRDRVKAPAESGFRTPLGLIERDDELLAYLAEEIDIGADRDIDNTVEIQIPLVRYAFPAAKVLWLRCPPNEQAILAGKRLAAAAKELGRRIAVVGSTDLTHYGESYGFEPAGHGTRGLSWMRDINDRRFIDALLNMDAREIIQRGAGEHSACSAGAAAAAVSFASASFAAAAIGADVTGSKGDLLAYATSYDKHPGDSFVGYASVVYRPPAS